MVSAALSGSHGPSSDRWDEGVFLQPSPPLVVSLEIVLVSRERAPLSLLYLTVSAGSPVLRHKLQLPWVGLIGQIRQTFFLEQVGTKLPEGADHDKECGHHGGQHTGLAPGSSVLGNGVWYNSCNSGRKVLRKM